MKKTLQRLGIVTVGLSLCLWSCKEQDGLVKPNEATASVAPRIKEKIDFSVVEGRLKFETMEDFNSAIGKSISEQEMKNWESVVGFKSLNETFKEFLNTDSKGVITEEYDDVVIIVIDDKGKKGFDRALSMPALATLVNQNGLVQVADKVLKFSDIEVKITDVKYKDELALDFKGSHVVVNKVIQVEKELKTEKSSKVADYTYEVYNWWHYPGVPSSASDRRIRTRLLATLYNNGQNYIWDVGVQLLHERCDFWGWAACNIDGWKWGPGYVTIVPSGLDSKVTSNNILPYGSLTWTSGTYPGTADYFRHCQGVAYPTIPDSYFKLGMKASFRPGIITAQTYGDQDITFLSYDVDL